ncbi:hypothetical protein FACS1894137_15310 [Spirochaetia bacterium]|nr:hypothetical protein FACS1894137_15310 [Spirochaetia bacterium]
MMQKFYFYIRLPLVSLLLLCPLAPIFPLGFTIPGPSWGRGSLDILWSGAWAYEGNMVDRFDIRLNAHKPSLTLRAQVTDTRPAPPWDGFTAGNTAFAGGLYHGGTGSRLLWGILDEGGLPARLKNIWRHSPPFTEQHQGAIGNLRTEPSVTKKPAAYLWLGSPWWAIPQKGPRRILPWLGPMRGFGSVLLDDKTQAAFDGGFEIGLLKKSALRMEGFYTRQHLPARSPSTWFSETPPLPERDSDILAGTVLFNSPVFAAAADIARSQTFAYGKDLYGNLAFRIGDRPWRLSLAADAAGDRYVDRDGAAVGAGFRTAARLERRGKRSSLIKVSSTLRAGGIGEAFYKSSTLFYYHFPTAPVKSVHLFWPSRVSLTINRDAENPEKIEDGFKVLGGFRLWKLPLVFQAALTGLCAAENPLPYPGADYPYNFESAKFSAEASYALKIRRFKPLQFKTKLGYTMKKNGETPVETSLSVTTQGKWGRFNIKTSAGDFPRDWALSVSWRLEL